MSFRAKRRNLLLAAAALLLLAYLLCLPRNIFRNTSYSTVVESAEGDLLGARIAADGQWRFPPCDTVPERFATALIQFEDRHFRYHPGVNPVSLLRAARDNFRSGHIVSGGSTITMQVIRLSRQRDRNLWQKMVEAVLATRLELRCSKRRILALYASPLSGGMWWGWRLLRGAISAARHPSFPGENPPPWRCCPTLLQPFISGVAGRSCCRSVIACCTG